MEVDLPSGSLVMDEIAQQPVLWPTTAERVRTSGLAQMVADAPVLLTGAGTSAYAGQAIAEGWRGARAIPTTDLLLLSAADLERAMPSFNEDGVVISLARSGDSPESVGVVERMQRLFPAVRHIAILCNDKGRLAHTPGVEVICLDPRTNDRSLAMTSSFSNLVLAGLCLVHATEIGPYLGEICERVERGLPRMNAVAEEIAAGGAGRLCVLTSSMHALADETALKILELTSGRVTTLAQTFLGLRHGPVSFLRGDTPVVCFASADAEKRRYERDVVAELNGRGLGRTIVVGDEEAAGWGAEWFVPAIAPDLPDWLRTAFEVPFAQLLAYHLSVSAGVNPDNPSPDGAITRVVTQFRIHQGAGAL